MARKVPSTSSSTTSTSTSASAQKSSTASTASSASSSVVPSTAQSAANVVVAPDTDAAPSSVSSLLALYAEYSTKLQQSHNTWSQLRSEFKVLERQTFRELKNAEKVIKKKRKAGNRAPSGFVKPTLISSELAEFLGKPVGTEMARTEVTREINKYIQANSLQNKENGRHINPDKKLQSLLKLKKGEELTYFNLQRYMSPHFAKAASKTSVTGGGAAAPVVSLI